jgi:hypothetical protein
LKIPACIANIGAMSLRTLFLLMGLVTSAMVAGVIYTKVLREPGEGHVSMAEQRAIDRVCDIQCADQASALSKTAQTPDELEALARSCVADCRVNLREKYKRSAR